MNVLRHTAFILLTLLGLLGVTNGKAVQAASVLFYGTPAVVLDGSGTEHIFVVGTDGNIWHNSQATAGAWVGWSVLGSNPHTRNAVKATKRSDGTVEVFTIHDGLEYTHSYQTSIGGSWSAWQYVDLDTIHHIVDQTSGNGMRIDVASNGVIPYLRQQNITGGAWSDWSDFSNGNTFYGDLSVLKYPSTCLEYFQIERSTNNVWHKYQYALGSAPPCSQWSSWSPVSPSSGYFDSYASPNAIINYNGVGEVFALNSGNVWHSYQAAPGQGPWSSWSPLLTADSNNSFTSGPASILYPNQHVEVFAVRNDGKVWHCYQTTPAGGWVGWFPFT